MPVEYHAATKKAMEDAEDPQARDEARRMGSVLASMTHKEVPGLQVKKPRDEPPNHEGLRR